MGAGEEKQGGGEGRERGMRGVSSFFEEEEGGCFRWFVVEEVDCEASHVCRGD